MMGNYTTLKLDVLINRSGMMKIKELDNWLHQTPLYNPEITPDYNWNSDQNRRILTDGSELVLTPYPGDSDPFFLNPKVNSILYLGVSDIRKDPTWSYDADMGELTIDAFFRNYDNQLDQFLTWLSPLVEKVDYSEFNTDDDLEGPRYIKLIDGSLQINRYSFTR